MKTRTITLKKKDIFHDIDVLSLSLSKLGDDVKKADTIATDTSTTNGTRIFTRLADKRVSDIRTALKDFLSAVTQTEGNDLISSSDYAISLYVTDELPDYVITSIIALMHDYVVKGALGDWYAELSVGPSANLIQMANDSLVKIRELIYERIIPTMS